MGETQRFGTNKKTQYGKEEDVERNYF